MLAKLEDNIIQPGFDQPLVCQFIPSSKAAGLARGANALAQCLQQQPGYTLAEAERQTVLLPFAQIWNEHSTTSLDDLLEAGLDFGAAAFLVGWLSIQQQHQQQ
jgi:hypothetical protein